MSLNEYIRLALCNFYNSQLTEGKGIVIYNKKHFSAAGPETLEDYFQKDAFLGQKAALNLWYVDTRPH